MTSAPATFDFKTTMSDKRLRGLWRMMRGYRAIYLSALLFIGLGAVINTLTYVLLAYFVDDILGRGIYTPTVLLVIALSFVGMALLQGFFTFWGGRLSAQTSEGIVQRLRDYLYDHIQRLSFRYHDKAQTGELIQRSTSDVDAIRRFFADQAVNAGRILMLFVINFLAILRLDARLAFFSVIVIPIVLIVSIWFFKRISKTYEAHQEQEAGLSTALQENLTGVRVVKAFARQTYEREKFEQANWELFLRGKKLLTFHAFYWPVTDILCGFQMLGGFLIAAVMTLNGVLTIGAYVAYVGLVIWLIWPMRNLGRLIVQMSSGLVSYGRVMDVVKEEREPLTEGAYRPQGVVQGAIEFRNVSFEYDASVAVLHEISFHCEPGQAVALLGPTGSGKSSLVNLLPRFYDYTGGVLLLDGVELRAYPRKFLRQHIGIVEQEPFLFSRTLRENITYGVGRNVPQSEIEAAAKAAAIHDVIMTFPGGYNTLVGEKGVTLSGGQKQRVAIARTLLKNPRILILDDSTSSVDLETEQEIREALERLMENRTTFIIAHRVQSVMNADLILVLDHGRIVQRGQHEDLLQQPGIYRQIYDIQTKIEAELEKEVNRSQLSAVSP
ncbi:putative ABC transporter ATP-binding protein [Thermoflexales bacterium]|nr:putative ABC transporter ATP-binding protein [Thermoflexales bacterium]